MANKTLSSITLIMEVENGVDKKGVTIYKNKTYPNVNLSATPTDIFDVANAIKSVLAVNTRGISTREVSNLSNQ